MSDVKLAAIIREMEANGESEELISKTVKAYQARQQAEPGKIEDSVGSATVESTSQALENGDSASEDTSSESQGDIHSWLTPEFFDKTEEEAIGDLRIKYPDFHFEETNTRETAGGYYSFNAIKVSSPDKTKSTVIEFNIGGRDVDIPNPELKALEEENKARAYEKSSSDLIGFVEGHKPVDYKATVEAKRELRRQILSDFHDYVDLTQEEQDDIDSRFPDTSVFEQREEELRGYAAGMDLKFTTAAPKKTVQP